MPLKNLDDTNHRFRSFSQSSQRPSIDMDIRPVSSANSRSFPQIGANLPTQPPPMRVQQRRLPVQNVTRPSAAMAAASAVNTAVAPAPIRQRLAPQRTKRRRIITKWRVFFAIILIFILLGGWLASKALFNTLKVFNGNLFSVLTTTKLKGEDQGRVNVLLAGNSADDPGHDGANLTDSIMIISIDLKHNTAYMLSVPRDLWVEIPGYGHAKINETYVDGQAGHFTNPGYPNGGMGLLEEVIHNNFDIPINYYALIDYNALRDGVNAVGGVDVTIHSDDPRGLYDPSIDWVTHGAMVKLTNGVHHLNGEQALDFARARGDAYGSYGFVRADFDRTEHQRMMLLALKNKVLTAGILANPITLSNLFDTVGKNVKTDLTLSEARRAYDLGKNIDNSKVISASLNNANGKNLLMSYLTPTNQSALIPAAGVDNFGQIQAYVRYLQTSDPVEREAADVVVLNGTDTSGLAAKAETALTSKKINVIAIGDATAKTDVTTIIDVSLGKKPATLNRLKQLYSGARVSTTNPYSKVYNTDFIVVLGNDQLPKTTSP
jgi:LCP family protein required for cell wall assembly